MRRRLLSLLICAALPLSAGALELDAPADIERLLEPHLPDEDGTPRRLQGLIDDILATEGYFSPNYDFSGGDEAPLRLKLDPGPRTHIASVDLAVDGPVDEKTRQALLDGWLLPVGKPFRQEDWNDAKQQILADLLAVEHPDARLADSQAEIDVDTRRAALRAHYDAGARYRFGELRVTGLQRYPASLVERYNRSARAGEAYRVDRLNELQTALQASPYFSSVRASLDRTAAETLPDGSVSAPVLVDVSERPAHRVGFGVGASSNTGARVEASYHTPDLFNQAWALDSGLRLEQKKSTLYGDVFLPPDDKNRRHSVGGMVETTDIQGLRTERYAVGAQSVQMRGSIEQRLSLNWQTETRHPDGAAPVLSRALVPNVMWIWRKVDNPLDPRRGLVAQFQVGGGAKAVLSDQNFVRVHSRSQVWLPLGARDTLSLRAEAGYTVADSRQHIPQDYLFRAGGTGSVRGYAYQSLGVKEGDATVGGRYLATLSAEATHWLSQDWGVAAFVDAGDAVDSLQDVRLAVGYGLGARWKSPAGPLGVDLAYGERDRQVQLHFSLAIPF